MRKVIVLASVVIMAVSIIACQKTPENISENENGVKIENKETLSIETNEKKLSEDLQIPTHIQTSFEGIDYLVTIDCDVKTSESEVTTGRLKPFDIPLESVRDVVNPNAEWIARDGGYYVLLPESEMSEDNVDYLIRLEKDTDGYIDYDNRNTVVFPPMAEIVRVSEQTDEMRSYSEQCKSYANTLLKQLNLNCEVKDGIFCALNDQWYMMYYLMFKIDNVPIFDYLYMSSGGVTAYETANIWGEIEVTNTQTGKLTFNENYEVKSRQVEHLIQWDTVMDCFKSAIENGITKYKMNDICVSKIQMEYYVLDDWSYVPVWTFYIPWANDEHPIVSINACTGDVMYDW